MTTNENIRHKTIIGVIWTFLEQLSRVGIQAVTTMILTWFLLPEEFGLMAMITVFFTIGNSLMDSGFSQALIRKKEIKQIDYSTAFYANLVLGLVAYLILYLMAPFISNFYDDFRLTNLVRAVGLVIVINSFIVVQVAELARDLNFKTQFRISLISSLVSAILAIYLAFLGFGVWSLAAQMLISSLGATILYWSINKWRPIRKFSTKSLKEMYGFGSKLFLSGLIDTVFQNIYTIVIGKLFLAEYVGYYFFSLQIQQALVLEITNSVQKVTYPALSTIQDNDKALKEFYRKIIQVTTYIIFPSMVLLAVLAKPIFNVFLKDSWLPAVPYLQLLCISGLLYPLHAINLNILKVKGRSDLFLYLEVIKKSITITILLISVNFGIFGIIIGKIFVSVLSYIPNSYYSIKLIDYSPFEQLEDIIPALISSIGMGFFVYLIDLMFQFGNIINLILIGLLGIVFYILINYSLKLPAQLFIVQVIGEKFNLRSFNERTR